MPASAERARRACGRPKRRGAAGQPASHAGGTRVRRQQPSGLRTCDATVRRAATHDVGRRVAPNRAVVDGAGSPGFATWSRASARRVVQCPWRRPLPRSPASGRRLGLFSPPPTLLAPTAPRAGVSHRLGGAPASGPLDSRSRPPAAAGRWLDGDGCAVPAEVKIERKFVLPSVPPGPHGHRSDRVKPRCVRVANDGVEVGDRRRGDPVTSGAGRVCVEEEIPIDKRRPTGRSPLSARPPVGHHPP
jgi:hypothetical protein